MIACEGRRFTVHWPTGMHGEEGVRVFMIPHTNGFSFERGNRPRPLRSASQIGLVQSGCICSSRMERRLRISA